ncbi:MAG TPA: hypothetical protein VIG64_05400 [Actinomycetota bacterium]|jgi:hypothetical protein
MRTPAMPRPYALGVVALLILGVVPPATAQGSCHGHRVTISGTSGDDQLEG